MKIIKLAVKAANQDNVWDGTKVSGVDNTTSLAGGSSDPTATLSSSLVEGTDVILTDGTSEIDGSIIYIAAISGDGTEAWISVPSADLTTLGSSFDVKIDGAVIGTVTNTDGEIEFEKKKQPTNEIKYTSTNGQVISDFNTASNFGDNLTLVSNTYSNGKGIAVYSDNVIKVEEYALYDCSSLSSITIPSSVTSIGEGAFACCTSLDSITIPSSVTSIGDAAFSVCTSISSITIPDSVTSIGISAFGGCTGLSSITIPSSITSIGNNMFSGCTSLDSITIPSSVTSIGSYAFYNCTGLSSITIPSSVTSIGKSAFSGCTELESINIPSTVTSIDEGVFYNCYSLESIDLSSSKVTSIEDDTFYNCYNLTSISLPSTLTSIGDSAFNDDSNFESISLPSGITSIGFQAFSGCSSLYSITIYATTPPELGMNAFYGVADNLEIYVPSEALSTYRETTGWREYERNIKTS